jgi:hypothetical protein
MFPLLRRPDGRHRGNDRRNTMRSGAELDDNLAQVHPLLPSYSSKPSATHRFPESTEYLRSEAPNQSPSRGLKESLTSTYSTSTRSPHYFRHWSYIFVSWRWELGTWLLGSLAFATIIVLLLIYKDDRLTSWKSDIQITTIIAALSALAQSALLVSLSAGLGQLKWTWITDLRTVTDLETFDEASRGPYGSAKLILLGLWTGKVREHSAKPLAEAASSKAKGSSVFPYVDIHLYISHAYFLTQFTAGLQLWGRWQSFSCWASAHSSSRRWQLFSSNMSFSMRILLSLEPQYTSKRIEPLYSLYLG